MSVRTYNPSVRVGNWNEDLCLQEDQLKDFLDKKESGELTIQKATNLREKILREVKLTHPSDGYLHVGDKVTLMHMPTQTLVSAYMSEAQAHEAKQIVSGCDVSGSKLLLPCPRSVFVIGSFDADSKPGDLVYYGQHISFTTLPNEGGQLNLQTDRATFMKHSKHTREQHVTLEDELSYKSAWRLLCFRREDRLETEGEPVPVNERVFINHCKTNHHLAMHKDWTHRTPFGREYEVTACTKFNTHKVEDEHNHFAVVCGDPAEVAASLSTP